MNSKKNITLARTDNWYFENGYLTIDLELFGKYLCDVFNEHLGGHYHFQKFTPTVQTDKNRPIWQQGEEKKNLAIISPILYSEDSYLNYNRVRVVPMACPKPQYLESFTSYSKEYPSMFSKAPIKLDEKEFLLYFGDEALENVQICLGHIENGEFVPTDYFRTSPTAEIDHTNPIYKFVEDFIKAIFIYKILNRKSKLNESDMDAILEEFGINRIEKLRTVIGILKSIQEDSTEILLKSTLVGKVLKFQKNNEKDNGH